MNLKKYLPRNEAEAFIKKVDWDSFLELFPALGWNGKFEWKIESDFAGKPFLVAKIIYPISDMPLALGLREIHVVLHASVYKEAVDYNQEKLAACKEKGIFIVEPEDIDAVFGPETLWGIVSIRYISAGGRESPGIPYGEVRYVDGRWAMKRSAE